MNEDQANVLLDAVGALRRTMAVCDTPWRQYDIGDGNPLGTRDGYMDVLSRVESRLVNVLNGGEAAD